MTRTPDRNVPPRARELQYGTQPARSRARSHARTHTEPLLAMSRLCHETCPYRLSMCPHSRDSDSPSGTVVSKNDSTYRLYPYPILIPQRKPRVPFDPTDRRRHHEQLLPVAVIAMPTGSIEF